MTLAAGLKTHTEKWNQEKEVETEGRRGAETILMLNTVFISLIAIKISLKTLIPHELPHHL